MPNRFSMVDIINTVVENTGEEEYLYVLEQSITNAIKAGDQVAFSIGLKLNPDDTPFNFTVACGFINDEAHKDPDIRYVPDPETNSAKIEFINWDLTNPGAMKDIVSGKQSVIQSDSGVDLCIDFIMHFLNDPNKTVVLTMNFYSKTVVSH